MLPGGNIGTPGNIMYPGNSSGLAAVTSHGIAVSGNLI